MIKGIIFDMGGPLVQKNPNYTYNEVAETAENIRMQNYLINDLNSLNIL